MQDLTHHLPRESALVQKRVLLLLNPKSRQGARFIEPVTKWLLDQNCTIKTPSSESQTQSESFPQAIERLAPEVDVVIVGGGDGSINAALPALMKHKVPLLVLPLGTANSLARTLSLPLDPYEALALLQTGETKWVDVGLANSIPFLSVVGLGLSSQVNRLVRSNSKRWLGVFAFAWTALKVFWRMQPFKVNIICDGVSRRSPSWQVSVCNGKYYGSRLTISEDATLTDSRLHGVSSEMKNWWKGPFLIPALVMGRYRDVDDLTDFEGKHIRIETRRTMSVDIDGDIKTRTPLDITVCPKAIQIFVPSKTKPEGAANGSLKTE